MAESVHSVVLVDDHDLIRQGLARAFERARRLRRSSARPARCGGQGLAAATAAPRRRGHRPPPPGRHRPRPRPRAPEAERQDRHRRADHVRRRRPALRGRWRPARPRSSPRTPRPTRSWRAARHATSRRASFTAADLADAMRRRLSPTGPQLSAARAEVLRLLADGLGVAAIARQLFVSESTAKTHISEDLREARRHQPGAGPDERHGPDC